jgi:signal transduction histidine kinase
VRDEGPGIVPGMERTIFERHVSGSGSTGVGLALARELAESTGGRLELVAARPATFELYLSD